MTLPPASELTQELPTLNALSKELQQVNGRDQETGLFNYEAFLNAITTEISKAGPRPPASTLIEIRIRGLARIGEMPGRKAIGSAIRQLAEWLNNFPLGNRIIGRIDHKSFGIFLCDVSDPVVALQSAKQLTALCSRAAPWGDQKLNVEAIAGVAMTT